MMSAPPTSSWEALVNMGRFLMGARSLVQTVTAEGPVLGRLRWRPIRRLGTAQVALRPYEDRRAVRGA